MPLVSSSFSGFFFLSLLVGLSAPAQTNVLTQHNDIGRTGQNTTETILTPANVSSGNFGKVGALAVDGDAYAQPLYMSSLNIGGVNHSVVFIATEHDSVYAFDSGAGGQQLWKATLFDTAHGATAGAIPDPETDTGCTNVNGPEYGIMGTPVVDPTTNTMYVVSLTYENNYPVQRLHALDITNGDEKFGGPTTIQATVAGSGTGSSNGRLSFDPKWENQRAGLLLINGNLYIAWGSHCDAGPFHGWLMGYNASTLTQNGVFVTTPNGTASGIWMSGTGLAADNENGVARMFVPTGNGSYDATVPYGTNNMDYGEDILRLDLSSGMKVDDAFTPSDQAYLTSNDMDVASGGLIVLPDNLPGSAVPHEAVQMAKSGIITVLNRDNMGGYNPTDQALQEVTATSFTTVETGFGLWGAPVYWNENLYVWPTQSLPNGNLLQYQFTNGLLSTSPVAVSTQTESQHNGFQGATPSISANGNTNGILWIDDSGNQIGGVPQSLYALDATNVANTLWSSTANSSRDGAGITQKFAVPTIADGRVFLMASRQLLVYGLLDFSISAPAAAAVNPGNTTLTPIALSSSTSFTQTVQWTASGVPAGVTVTFTANANGSESALFTAATNAIAGTSNIAITASRGTTTQTATIALTVGGLTDFLLSAAPATTYLGTTAASAITVTPQNGFTGVPVYSVAGIQAGVSANLAGCSATGCTLLVSASPVTAVGLYTVTIQAASGTLTHFVTANVTVVRTGATNVDLSKFYNVNAAVSDGTPAANGGLDGAGYAFSATLLGNTPLWAGTNFQLGPANAPDAVAHQTVALPAGTFVNLQVLASGGGPGTEPVVINYTDGSSVNFLQGFSNWGQASGYPGESIADSMAYRVSPNGTTQPNGTGWKVYGYTFPINSAKTAQSVTLPPTGAVATLAMALSSSSSVAQTIFFSPVAPQQVGQSVALSATASSGLSVTITSVTASICTVSGSTASLVSAGTCTVTASQTGNTLYAPATPVSQSFTVAATQLSAQSITFPGVSPQTIGPSVSLIATASSGLAVTFASTTPAVCTVSGTIATAVAIGTCTITASQVGNGSYSAATPVSQSFTVNPLYQVPISLSALYNVESLVNSGTVPLNGGFDGSSYAYSANLLGSTVAWAGVQFTPGPPNVADSVSSATVPLPAGSFSSLRVLAAASFGTQTNQPFVLTYSDGTKTTVTQSLSDWGAPANYAGESIAVTTPYRITPNGSSQSFTWNTYGYSFPLTSAKTLVSITLPKNRQVVVLAMTLTSASPIMQTISFGAIASQPVNVSIALSATASSGLPVAFASTTPSVCTVSGTAATVAAGGTCTIIATQSGNTNYAAASSVSQSFTVALAAQSITFGALTTQRAGTTVALAATVTSGLAVTFSSSTPSICTVSGATASLVATGTCAITASQPGSGSYAAATPVSQSLTVAPPQVQVNLAGVSNVYGIFTNGSTVTNGGMDGAGYAFSANLLGSSAVWNGATFNFGAAGVADAISNVKVPLPAGSFASLQVLATGAFGSQPNQAFVVTYTDGTSTTFTQSVSEWGAPQSYPGESVAASMPYRLTPNGSTQAVVKWNIFGYSFALNSAKTVASITLPNNRSVIVMAMTLSPPAIAQTVNFGAVANQIVGTRLTLAATASSGLAVSYASSTTSVCTVSGSSATMVATGSCAITASQAGNSNYAAVTPVSQSFTVTSH